MSRRSLTLLLACSLVAAAGPWSAPATAQQRPAPRGAFRGIDGEFARLAEAVPGFGGYFYDRDGRLFVVLRDLSDLPAVEARLGAATPVLGRYGFQELDAWRHALRPVVLGLAGVVTLDVDEAVNRIAIGTDRALGRGPVRAVERAVARAGVPLEAVVIRQRDAMRFLSHQTLRDYVRPVIGGLQIRWSDYLCTLGFNAERHGTAGFVTASHCTLEQGGVKRRNATEYYQPLEQVPDELIGIERVDPQYFRSKGRSTECPRGYRCRYSDSAWAEYVDPADSGGSVLARTEYSQFDVAGSIVLDDAVPDFQVTATTTANTPVGNLVFRMGRTTGWTEGIVLESCVDVAVSGTSFALLCQDVGVGAVGPGDSGSPVFDWDFLANATDATLVGLLWAGDTTGTIFVYSPYGAVAQELGLDPIP